MKKIIVVLIVLLILGTGVTSWGWYQTNQLQTETAQTLSATEATLAATEMTLAKTKADLAILIPQKNPTYQELREFLDKDQTDNNTYVLENYQFVCVDFAAMLDNAAEKAGIRAGYVSLIFQFYQDKEWEWLHTVNVFETSDRGLIYIEPTRSTLLLGRSMPAKP